MAGATKFRGETALGELVCPTVWLCDMRKLTQHYFSFVCSEAGYAFGTYAFNQDQSDLICLLKPHRG